MSNPIYSGTYARFDTASKKEAGVILGADNLVGDIFTIEFKTENGVRTAWIKNRFGSYLGFFSEEISRELSLREAQGWELRALLAFVAYSEAPAPGLYWGEVALICYDPREHVEAFEIYLEKLGKRLADGNRPDIDLSAQAATELVNHNGDWQPSKLLSFPKLDPGTVYIKKRRSSTERLIEQGRKGNKGCYLASMFSFLLLIAAIIFGLRGCGII